MNRQSASRPAPFDTRVLIGLALLVADVSLALLASSALSASGSDLGKAQQTFEAFTYGKDPLVPPLFDCSKIHQLGIDKQRNFRAGAILIFCGQAQRGSASHFGSLSRISERLLPAQMYGTADVDLITGSEIFPNVTQSTTFTAGNPDNPLQIVVAYVDSRGRNANPVNLGGASVSTDAGNTFVRVTNASGQSPFATAGDNLGGPVVLYNKPTGTWFTLWLDGGCGDQGIGYYKSTAPWDADSWSHGCIYSGYGDRDSGWADNNPASPFYGRMYVSWNQYGFGGGLFVAYSADNGLTWTEARQISTDFIGNVQITGDLVTGDVYIAAMDEGGGALTHRSNYIYRSTDGGNSWTNTYNGPPFRAPGRLNCSGYWVCMYPDGGGYWRYMGWGQPAALNHVVHLVYSAGDLGAGDPANIFYIRSTDSGVTFTAPLQLNTDATTRAQWQPSLSVTASGDVFAVWYDERETASCMKGQPSVPCYRMWARRSTDNGASWLPDQPFSDVVTPLPDQVDPGIVLMYAGDYNYGSSVLNQHLAAWTDGRVTISSSSQQNVFFDTQAGGPTPTATATPIPTPPRRITPTPRSRPTPPPRPTPR
jgi:hypothetical protein